ncbi:uncharacterized protein J3R85_000823 [Psidium guajava]|nr:uncharacterized protein J3R85_000823 [Psidium guajava]
MHGNFIVDRLEACSPQIHAQKIALTATPQARALPSSFTRTRTRDQRDAAARGKGRKRQERERSSWVFLQNKKREKMAYIRDWVVFMHVCHMSSMRGSTYPSAYHL